MRKSPLPRRRVLQFCVSALAVGSWARADRALAEGALIVPADAFRLTRRLSRGLRDGKAIVVSRSWRIRFARQARGIAITGRQTAVSVEAPPVLARLSRIEEERSTEGTFPVLLAPDGTIMAMGERRAQASFEAAVRAAKDLLGRDEPAGAGPSPHDAYLAQLADAGSELLDQWPGDLFYPSTEPFRQLERIDLPGGAIGEFEVTWTATTQERLALLHRARREVITRIAGSERRSSEDWSLEKL